jgi:hypothetical protein
MLAVKGLVRQAEAQSGESSQGQQDEGPQVWLELLVMAIRAVMALLRVTGL